ncbi:MAG: MAE_28990/MAE_18760 family HEPN-like nuclease [Terriglobales bacterium]
MLITHGPAPSALSGESPADPGEAAKAVRAFVEFPGGAPDKLDWQTYDHCAALTRLYAVYDRFVAELVAEFILLLPRLYLKYADLPPDLIKHHRIGIGQILLKMGEKGRYKNLEEGAVVQELAAGLSGSSYTLVADAFFVDRQNLRFDVLCRLLSGLGFKHSGRYINQHAAVSEFIKSERADSSSAQKELEEFIDYRNEAAHKRVENLLGVDQISAVGRFLTALGTALADMFEEGVLYRRMELNQYKSVMTVAETHYGGQVVIGTPGIGTRIDVGDELIVVSGNVCRRVTVETLRLNGQPSEGVTADGIFEVGLRLNKRSPKGADLRRLEIPAEVPQEMQLNLEEFMQSLDDAADTDAADALEQQDSDPADADETGAA